MSCPNFSNKEVFDSFNQIIESFGGKPMTEEEFKDSNLRHARQGVDYSAMELAYRAWNANGGQPLTIAPDGEHSSELYQYLFNLNGTLLTAIRDKATLLVDDKIQNLIKYIRKYTPDAYDENGEFNSKYYELALSVYSDDSISPFNTEALDTEAVDVVLKQKENHPFDNKTARVYIKGHPEKGWFELVKDAENGQYSVHFKTAREGTTETLSDGTVVRGSTREERAPLYKAIRAMIPDGAIVSTWGSLTPGGVYALNKVGLGWEVVGNRDVTYKKSYGGGLLSIPVFKKVQTQENPAEIHEEAQYVRFGETNIFKSGVMDRITTGETVNSAELLAELINDPNTTAAHKALFACLRLFNIPIVKGSLALGQICEAITEKSGKTAIIVDTSQASKISNTMFSEIVCHEMIHAATVGIINNPTTETQRRLVLLNRKVFDIFNKLFPLETYSRADTQVGYYALANEKEFVAYFMSDPIVREMVYDTARRDDIRRNGRILNTIKRFINTLARVFSRSVFNTNEEVVSRYERSMKNYIYNTPEQLSNEIPSSRTLAYIYNNMDNGVVDADAFSIIARNMKRDGDAIEANNYLMGKFHKKNVNLELSAKDALAARFDARIKALRATCAISEDSRQRLLLAAESQKYLFENDKISLFEAISSFLAQAGPDIHEAVSKIKMVMYNGGKLSDTELQYEINDNIGMYQKILESIVLMLEDYGDNVDNLVTSYNNLVGKDGVKISAETIKNAYQNAVSLMGVCQQGNLALQTLLLNNATATIERVATDRGAISGVEYAQNLKELGVGVVFKGDISALARMGGTADSSSNDVLRILSHLVNKAINNADNDSIFTLTPMLEAAKNLSHGEKVTDLYELDEDGCTTGYLVRRRKYGLFYREYDQLLKELNQLTNSMFGTSLDLENRLSPDITDNDRLLAISNSKYVEDGTYSAVTFWEMARQNWLAKHCERRYVAEYYLKWAGLSNLSKLALQKINTQINAMLSKPGITEYIDGNRVMHLDKISKKEQDAYLNLLLQKRLLRSEYDEFGNKKEGIALLMAHELKLLHDNLYDGQTTKKNRAAWEFARAEVIKECGGIDELLKYQAGEENKFDYKKLKDWDFWNTRFELRRDTDGTPLVMYEIQRELRGMSPDYGEEYDKLSQQIRDMLRPYIKPNGEYDAKRMSNKLKGEIRNIEIKQLKIRLAAFKNNPALKKQAELSGKTWNKYVEFVETEDFKEELNKLAKLVEGDLELYEMSKQVFGTGHFNMLLGMYDSFRPFRWYTKMEAKDKEAFMVMNPSDSWIETNSNSKWINPNFDSSENTTYVPKLQIDGESGAAARRYDNSRLYDKIRNSSTLSNLYDTTLDIMHKANEKQSNRAYADDYLLPQVPGSLYKALKHKHWYQKWGIFWHWVGDRIGFHPFSKDDTINNNDTELFGADDIDVTDETGATINNTQSAKGRKRNTYSGMRPNGKPFNIIPQYYTRKLKDPSTISSDLCGIVASYYNMSAKYEERNKIKDTCETLLDMLAMLKFANENQFKRWDREFVSNLEDDYSLYTGKTVEGTESNTWQMGRKFLDMNLYDIRRTGKGTRVAGLEIAKFTNLLNRYTSAHNLGMNPAVAITGFTTAMYAHLINAITGQKYSMACAAGSAKELVLHLITNLCGAKYINNHLSNDKIMCLMEELNVAGYGDTKFKNSNRNRLAQAIYENTLYGMMSTGDFLVKSQIMIATLMSYHYVDGKFITQDDIRNDQWVGGENSKLWRKDMMKKWKRGVSLYSVLNVKNHKIECDAKYKQAYLDIKFTVTSRAQKYSAAADGIPTGTQKIAVSQSLIGSLILIHRQYLPLLVQERYGNTVYDYDMQLMKNGLFRVLMQFIANIAKTGPLIGTGVGAAVGTLAPVLSSLGPIGTVAGAIGGYLLGRYGKKHGATSRKEVVRRMFNDYSDAKSALRSQINRYHIKQVIAELLIYNLIIKNLVNAICKWADDSDDDDNWFKQQVAYWARKFQWESYTPYRFDDMFSNFKSVSAATSSVDATDAFMQDIGNAATSGFSTLMYTLFPLGTLIDPFVGLLDPSTNEHQQNIIKRGVYKGHSTYYRDFNKLLPHHNLYEQMYGSKQKRNYMEHQIMKMRKEEK